jgi:hypothetical protein
MQDHSSQNQVQPFCQGLPGCQGKVSRGISVKSYGLSSVNVRFMIVLKGNRIVMLALSLIEMQFDVQKSHKTDQNYNCQFL